MTEKDMPPDDKNKESEPEEPEHHKSRRHGYRGYPNNPSVGGDIHSGSGFAGVGSTELGTGSEPSFISDKTRESVEELGEEEEEDEKE